MLKGGEKEKMRNWIREREGDEWDEERERKRKLVGLNKRERGEFDKKKEEDALDERERGGVNFI